MLFSFGPIFIKNINMCRYIQKRNNKTFIKAIKVFHRSLKPQNNKEIHGRMNEIICMYIFLLLHFYPSNDFTGSTTRDKLAYLQAYDSFLFPTYLVSVISVIIQAYYLSYIAFKSLII